jgi:hypothetical protein
MADGSEHIDIRRDLQMQGCNSRGGGTEKTPANKGRLKQQIRFTSNNRNVFNSMIASNMKEQQDTSYSRTSATSGKPAT